MPTRRLFLATLVAVAFFGNLLTSPAARADGASLARGHVEQAVNAAIDLVRRPDLSPDERDAALAELLHESLDIPFIARVVLGKSWRKATPDQQQRFTEIFEVHLIRSIARSLEGYDVRRMTTLKVTAKGETDLLVHSRIERPNSEPVKALWRVRQFDAGPRIIDLTVEGISLVITKREEFTAVIRSQGLDSLIQVLEVKSQPSVAVAN